MAGSSLLTLIDDIATLLDDVAILSKVAAKKTAGVLGDDLALNAEQVSGVRAEREIPVVWAVAKGSFKNKLILVPGALLLSAFLPWLLTPLLMLGGGFLCYEGFEKIAHRLFHNKEDDKKEHQEKIQALVDPNIDLCEFEAKKIQGAIRTDFILSAEIIVIALNTVKDQPFITQALVVSLIALVITIGVYGLVAGIVKLDDAGLFLIKNKGQSFWEKVKNSFGQGLLWFAPFLMKSLSVLGTIAMFLVGGGILVHGLSFIQKVEHGFSEFIMNIPTIGEWLHYISSHLFALIFGLLAGAIILVVINFISRAFKLNNH